MNFHYCSDKIIKLKGSDKYGYNDAARQYKQS